MESDQQRDIIEQEVAPSRDQADERSTYDDLLDDSQHGHQEELIEPRIVPLRDEGAERSQYDNMTENRENDIIEPEVTVNKIEDECDEGNDDAETRQVPSKKGGKRRCICCCGKGSSNEMVIEEGITWTEAPYVSQSAPPKKPDELGILMTNCIAEYHGVGIQVETRSLGTQFNIPEQLGKAWPSKLPKSEVCRVVDAVAHRNNRILALMRANEYNDKCLVEGNRGCSFIIELKTYESEPMNAEILLEAYVYSLERRNFKSLHMQGSFVQTKNWSAFLRRCFLMDVNCLDDMAKAVDIVEAGILRPEWIPLMQGHRILTSINELILTKKKGWKKLMNEVAEDVAKKNDAKAIYMNLASEKKQIDWLWSMESSQFVEFARKKGYNFKRLI